MASHPSPMGSSKRRSTRMHQGRQPRHPTCAPPHIYYCSAPPHIFYCSAQQCPAHASHRSRHPPCTDSSYNNLRNPTCLKLWAKCTRTIVNRSKADASTAIHRTHERLTHYFRYRRKKKTATPTQPSTNLISSTTAHNPTRQIWRGRDRSNTTPTTHNISICAASLGRSCKRRCLLHPTQRGGRI